jgi:hypothetical protein
MPSTTFINDAQKCSKNIITCKELGEDLPAVRITPTYINDAYKSNKNIITCKIFPCTVLEGLGLHPWAKTKSRIILCHLLKAPRLTEFFSLISLLTDFDKSGEQSVTGSAQVGSLGSVEKRLQNWMKDLIHQNKRLMINLPPASVTYYFLREQSHKIFVSIITKTNHLAHSRPSVSWMYQGASCNKLAHMLNGNRNRCYNIGMWNCRKGLTNRENLPKAKIVDVKDFLMTNDLQLLCLRRIYMESYQESEESNL